MAISNKLAALAQALTLSAHNLTVIAQAFAAAMADGLAGKRSSLKMLPAHLGKPSGQERGCYLALDFGGTNVRVVLVELTGNGRYTVKQHLSIPLKDPAGTFDYTTSQAAAEDLFDFLAGQIARLASPADNYPLGHTFSFPCRQQRVNQAILLNWTKEIGTCGVEGHDVGQLLDEALYRQGLGNIKACAILNDTVGTLLTGAYHDSNTDIGSICGTGHNTCYFEPRPPWGDKPMIINMESGNYDQLPLTRYDQQLNAATNRPGEQRLEKMTAGRYLGELVRLITQDLSERGLLFSGFNNKLKIPYILTGEDLGIILADTTSDLAITEEHLARRFNLITTVNDRNSLHTIAELIVNRSARLVAATFAGVILHLDPGFEHCHTIAVDGSLYEKMPGYAGHLREALYEIIGGKAARVQLCLTKDGSGIGAAIAAAVVSRGRCS